LHGHEKKFPTSCSTRIAYLSPRSRVIGQSKLRRSMLVKSLFKESLCWIFSTHSHCCYGKLIVTQNFLHHCRINWPSFDLCLRLILNFYCILNMCLLTNTTLQEAPPTILKKISLSIITLIPCNETIDLVLELQVHDLSMDTKVNPLY
jgi:hypothetical protein